MAVRFGLVGCGRIAEKHIRSIVRCADARLVAVSDVVPERMEQAERMYHQHSGNSEPLKRYADYRDMMSDSEVQAIVIATVSSLHASVAKAALSQGKHLVLEKPMALSLGEAEQIIRQAESGDLIVMVCHQLRYRPVMRKIKEYLEQGRLGAVYLGVVSIRIHRSRDYYAKAPWRGSWTEDGGMLVNQGIHLVDLLQWFLGDVKQVYGAITRATQQKEIEDVALGVVTFANQAKGVIEANTVTYPNNLEYAISLFGEKGTISLGGPALNRLVRWSVEGDPQPGQIDALLADTDEHLYMYEEFVQAIQSDAKSVLIDGREGKRALETIFALYQSSLVNQPVPLPLPSFSTATMKGIG